MKRRSWLDAGDPEQYVELTDIIDEGASGAVFEGVLKNERVAVKVIPGLEDVVINQEVKDEIKILRQLAPSSHFVGFRGAWEKEEHAWIAMEICDGGSAIDLCQICQTTLKPEECAALCASVLMALKYLHGTLGIIHRDIKGKNILFTRDGRVKLSDLGIAVVSPERDSKLKPLPAGSPHWMAPELSSKAVTCYANDIWSLGITLIELIEGEPPHSQVSPVEVLKVVENSEPPTFTPATRKAVGVELISFLAACVVKDHAARPSAVNLLRHPFVDKCVMHLMVSDQPDAAIKALVERALPIITEYREFEKVRRAELIVAQQEILNSPAKKEDAHHQQQQQSSQKWSEADGDLFVVDDAKDDVKIDKPKPTWSEADGDLVVLDDEEETKPAATKPKVKWSEADGDLIVLDEQNNKAAGSKAKWSEADGDLVHLAEQRRSVRMDFIQQNDQQEESAYKHHESELNANRARKRPESIKASEKLVQSRQGGARRQSEAVRESEQVRAMQARLAQIQSKFDKEVSRMKKFLPKEAFQ